LVAIRKVKPANWLTGAVATSNPMLTQDDLIELTQHEQSDAVLRWH
jgi:hypothetical protein